MNWGVARDWMPARNLQKLDSDEMRRFDRLRRPLQCSHVRLEGLHVEVRSRFVASSGQRQPMN
jgi:hypothetical protein